MKISLKKQRFFLVLAGLLSISVALFIILSIFRDNLVFFFSPTELMSRQDLKNKIIRVGGLVEKGSLKKHGREVEFEITDMSNNLKIHYTGIVPDLFREGQGVVVEGQMGDGYFEANQLLAKHDEKYMPPEVARAIKKSGRWKGK